MGMLKKAMLAIDGGHFHGNFISIFLVISCHLLSDFNKGFSLFWNYLHEGVFCDWELYYSSPFFLVSNITSRLGSEGQRCFTEAKITSLHYIFIIHTAYNYQNTFQKLSISQINTIIYLNCLIKIRPTNYLPYKR